MKTETQIQAKEVLDSCYLSQAFMNEGQARVVEGCRRQCKRTGDLSEKQIETLKSILRYLPKEVRFSRAVADNWKH